MGAATEEDLKWLDELDVQDPAAEAQSQTQSGYEPWFEFDPNAQDAGLVNSLRLIGNLPYSTYKVLESMAIAGSSPLQVGKAMLQTAAGSGVALANDLGIPGLEGPETEGSQMARQMGQYFINRIKNPGKTIVEDPMGAALDVSALAGAGAGPMARGIATATNPARMTGQGIRGGLSAIGGAALGGGAQAAGFTTGFEPRMFTQMAKSAREGRRSLSKAALREKVGAESVLESFEAAVSRVREKRRADYQAKLPTIKMKAGADPLDVGSLRTTILEKLQDESGFRVQVTWNPSATKPKLDFSGSALQTAPAAQARIRRLVDLLYDWNDTSPRGFDILKQNIGNLHESAERFARSNVLIDEAYDMARSQLVDKVDGYESLVRDYETMSKALTRFKKVLGSGSDNPETTLGKLTGVLKENPTSEMRTAIMEELESLGGKGILDQIAGLNLSQLSPKGLIGRGAAASVVGMGGYVMGGYAGGALGAIAFLPLTSPRVMGEFFSALGAGQRTVDKITKLYGNIYAAVPNAAELAARGITLGGAIEHARMKSQAYEGFKMPDDKVSSPSPAFSR